MDPPVLMRLLLALVFAAFPTVEGQSCAITQSTVAVGGPSNFRDPSQYRYVLRGISKGSLPTSFTWRREGVVLSSSGPYNIADPVLTTSENPCSNRFYESRVTVIGKVIGEFTYTVRNEVTDSDVVGTLTIEAANNPSNLMLHQNGRFTVEISWSLSATPPSRGYLLSFGSDAFSGTTITNPYTYTAFAMQVGGLITVRLVAMSEHFFSDVLGPKSITLRDLMAPIVTSSSVTATSATLVLAQPMDSLPADHYTVTLTRRTGGQIECQHVSGSVTMTSSSDSVMFEGLQESSVYSVSVTARTSFDLTRTISPADITTLTAVPGAAPRGFKNGTVTSRSIALSWRNINCIQRNGRITSFEIRYGQVAGVLTTITIGSSDSTSYTVEGLLPFTEYMFQLAGTNINGTGPYTAFIGPIRTDEDVPGAVSDLTGNVKFYSMVLSWSPPQMPNGVLTGYDIMYTVNDCSSLTSQATSKPQHTIRDLQPRTTISNITITASTRIGAGEPTQFSRVFITLSEPPMVTNVVVTVLTDTSVRVSWEKLSISEITQYLVIYSRAGNRKRQSTESIIMVNYTENSVGITGLNTGAGYQFQVVAQAFVGGMIIMGQRSSLTSMSVLEVTDTNLSSSTKCTSLVAITGVLVFISTVVLYSVILTLVLVAFFCHRNLNSSQQETVNQYEDVNRNEEVELKECQAYGQVSALEHTSQEGSPAAIEYEGVYENI